MKSTLTTQGYGLTPRRITCVAAIALFAGCSAEAGAGSDDIAVANQGEALIGGSQAAPYHFRSTVGIGDVCTAAKVGPRQFLTAAHCVALSRPGRFEPVPPGFPANEGVRDEYLPGEPLLINWGLNADDSEQGTFTVVETVIHPSWWACPLCQDPILAQGGAADVAVIEILEDTPQIPEATVDLTPVAVGTPVVKVGWGCEVRTDVDPNTVELGRYKTADAVTIAASEIQHHNSPITNEQVNTVASSYLITEGRDKNPSRASLCLGDSGGPVYLPNNNQRRVVGVNSDYTFRPAETEEDGGVSWTDWHTKVSTDSLHGVDEWLIDLGVNTVGGAPSPSQCSCPSGCNAVQTASVPFTQQGAVDRCYFFPNLGYSVNNHSMVSANLNGVNITNQWVGNWSYPARRDGGYYLYLKGTQSWSWAQALQ